ncbi:MAG TPA: hypothetical protein VEV41_05975 [Terriglobales bacterium]|nr:hypothetical protein [Terriglobales bacterium]
MSYRYEMTELLIDIRFRFGEINREQQLTPEDKKRIKEFFLQHMIAPKARKVLEQYFPKEFAKAASSPAARKTSSHQDR